MTNQTFLPRSCEEIDRSFSQLCAAYPTLTQPVQALLPTLDGETALAMKYLYSTMALSDMANYPPELFLDYAAHSVFLWRELPAVQSLPEEVYLEYVLQPRVNSEELRPCSRQFYAELFPIVADKDPMEAILEANYWCASHVTYRTSDGRTLSALATYACGQGRCGEESVFAVSALRSVGIPARQVYVPRWGHCDDNHAWVEVWCEGTWYYMGACEPEPVLNLGWFNSAASRAMMVDYRSYQPFRTGATTPLVASVSQIQRYVNPCTVTVRVLSPAGTPIAGARVEFCLLNMAEYFPVFTATTDADGVATMETGHGTLYLQIHDGENHAFVPLHTRQEQTVTVTLSPEQPAPCDWQQLDVCAPPECPAETNRPAPLTPAQTAEKKIRLAEADALRHARKDSWSNPQLELFLNRETYHDWRPVLLSTLSEKDRMDCMADVLEEHLLCAMEVKDQVPEALFVPYVLAPRVGMEILTLYRRRILQLMGDQAQQLRRNPRLLWQWIDARVQSVPLREHGTLITTPAACLERGYGSEKSRQILFVVAARTLGIPARLNSRDGAMEYWDGAEFVPVDPAIVRDATLILDCAEAGTDWVYALNWSLGRWDGSAFVTLQLGSIPWEEGRLVLKLRPGTYRMITTNRLPGGNQSVLQKCFTLQGGTTARETLTLRPIRVQDLLVEVNLPEFSLFTPEGEAISAAGITRGDDCILLWLDPGREPTEHILNELLEHKEAFARMGDRLRLIVDSPDTRYDPKIRQVLAGLPRAALLCGDFAADVERLARKMYVDPEKLPLVILFRGSLRGIYAVSGYQVGTGGLLLQLMS